MHNNTDKIINDLSSDMFSNKLNIPIYESGNNRRLQLFLYLLVLMSIVSWLFGSFVFWGFNITGWSWVLPATIAGTICVANIGRIAFPVILWLPWLGNLLLYWFLGRVNPDALQSLLQIISPLAVGCAASIFRLGGFQMELIIRLITRLAWLFCSLLLVRFLLIPPDLLPDFELVSATAIIGLLLLGAFYASFYACGSGRHLIYYIVLVAITVTAMIRGPIVAMSSCLPLTLAPLKVRARIIMCICLIIFAVIVFNTENMQNRMFHSGKGNWEDLNLNNPNFRASGRAAMWNILWDGVVTEPWLGHGWNFHRVTLPLSGLPTYQPHNDWLRLLYDLGFIGTSIYFITIILQIFSLLKIARWSSGAHQMLAFGVATAFIPYMIIMFTDNAILYVQFFGDLHFALIGTVYGRLKQAVI